MLLTLALGLALIQQGAADTDTTIAVPSGTRLAVSLANGTVRIRTWDRGQVRIQGRHSSRTSLAIRIEGAVLRIEPRGRMGMPGATDLDLTLPAGMDAAMDGMNLDVDAEGMRGALKAEAMNGDFVIRNGADLDLSVMNGDLRVTGGSGRIQLGTVSGDITATGVGGELLAEAISGSIGLYRIESSRVEAEAVSGDIMYQGTVRDNGSYVLGSHSGQVYFGMPANANATVNTATMSGAVSASFTLPALEERSRSRRVVRFGTGSARVELESFSGRIRLVRPDEVPAQAERRPRREREDYDDLQAWADGIDLAGAVLDGLDLDVGPDLSSLAGLGGLAMLGVDLGLTVAASMSHEWRHGARPEVWRELRPDLRLDLDLRLDRKARDRSPDRLER